MTIAFTGTFAPTFARAFARAFAGVIACGGLLVAAPAAAHQHHHAPVSEVTEEGELGAPTVVATTVTTESASYAVDGHRGHYLLTAIGAEFAPLPWLALSAHAPFAYLSPEEGEDELGLGDLGAGLRAELYRSEGGGLSLSAGLGAMFPTGDEAVGLGSGHLMLAPSVALTASPGAGWLVSLHVVDAFPIAGQNHDDHEAMGTDMEGGMDMASTDVGVSLVTPHEPHELQMRAGAVKSLGPVHAGLHSQLIVPWSDEDRAVGPVTLGADAGWHVGGPLRLAAAFDLPVTDARYFDWKAGLSASLSF